MLVIKNSVLLDCFIMVIEMVKCKKVFCFLLKSTFYLNIQGELSIMFAKIYD